MATFTPMGPRVAGPAGTSSPAYPAFTGVSVPSIPPATPALTVRPINPLPATLIIGSSYAMSLAPLVLPFAALLSWWLR